MSESSAQLSKISKQLLEDVNLVNESYKFAIDKTKAFLKIATEDNLVHHITIKYATWIYCNFNNDEKAYYTFLEKALKERSQSGNTLFGWNIPNREYPNSESERILNRIDLALNYLRTSLDMELPYKLKGPDRNQKHSIRNGSWHQAELLEKVRSLAISVYDLFG